MADAGAGATLSPRVPRAAREKARGSRTDYGAIVDDILSISRGHLLTR